MYDVDADLQEIDRTKRIVERVWEAIESQIFYALWLSRFMAESQQPVAHGSASSRRKRARSRRSAVGRSGEVWWLSGQRAAMRTRARKRDRQQFFVSGHGDCSRGRKWHPQSNFAMGFAPGPQEHLGLWFAHSACACPATARPSPALRAAHWLRSLTLLVACPPELGRHGSPGRRPRSPASPSSGPPTGSATPGSTSNRRESRGTSPL